MNEDELKDQEGCGDRPSPPQAAVTVYYLSAVHLDAAHSFVSQLNGTILSLHFIEKNQSLKFAVVKATLNVISSFENINVTPHVWCQQRPVCGGPIRSTVVLFFRPLQCDGISTEVCPINGSEPTWML